MIDPKHEMKEGDRVSLPYELLNEIYSTLAELPAKHSMQILLAIQQEAEVVNADSLQLLPSDD